MPNLTRLLRAVAVPTVAISLATCGGGNPDDRSPEKERVIGATGFELALPDGWRRVDPGEGEVLRLMAGRNGKGDALLTVSRVPSSPSASLEQVAILARLRLLATVPQLSESDLGPLRATSLGNEPARAYDTDFRLQGLQSTVKGSIALQDGVAYTVVFAAPVANTGRVRDHRQILESWRWKAVQEGAQSDVAPAKGPPVGGAAYQFNLPRGWRASTPETPPGVEPPPGFVLPDILVTRNAIDGVSVTMSVTVRRDASPTLDEFVDGKSARFLALGASTTKTSLGGVPAITAIRDRDGIGDVPLRAQTIAALRNGRSYVVDFSAPREQFDKPLRAFHAAMASWRWR